MDTRDDSVNRNAPSHPCAAERWGCQGRRTLRVDSSVRWKKPGRLPAVAGNSTGRGWGVFACCCQRASRVKLWAPCCRRWPPVAASFSGVSVLIKPRTMPGVMELLPRDQIAFQRMLDVIRRNDERFGFLPIETRSEEHTSELQSLMRISYAVF